MKPTRLLLLVLGVAMALLAVPAVSQARDRNHDGIPDRWEKHFHLSLHVNQANRDQDRDHVDNANEFREHTNPRRRDTNHNGRPDGREDRDHDGLNNAAEDATGNDPIDKDTDNDGIPDGKEQAGTVSSFNTSTGELTIDLANNRGSVTGTVTNATEVKCETENEAEDNTPSASASRDGENSGPGSDNSGDNRGENENQNEVENENENEVENEHGDDRARGDQCPAGALAPGARVHEAELNVLSSGPVWNEIDLLTP